MYKNKTDQKKLRLTLPLIKLKELVDEKMTIKDLQLIFSDDSLSATAANQFELLRKSGALEYCHLVQLEYHSISMELLKEEFADTKIVELFVF